MADVGDRASVAAAIRVAAVVAIAYVGIKALANNLVDLVLNPAWLLFAGIVALFLSVILWLSFGIARRLENGQRFGVLGALAFWSLLLALACDEIPNFFNRLPAEEPFESDPYGPSLFTVERYTGVGLQRLIWFIVGYAIFLYIAGRLLQASESGHRTRLFDQEGRIRVLPAIPIVAMSLFLYLIWDSGFLQDVFLAVSHTDHFEVPWFLNWIQIAILNLSAGVANLLQMTASVGPFLVAAWLPIGWLTLTTVADANSVHIALRGLDVSLLRAPWGRVRRIDVVHHKRLAPSVTVHYWTWLFTPFSFGVHAKHYAEGTDVTDEVISLAEQAGVRRKDWYSPDWMVPLAYAFLAAGFGLALLLAARMTSLFERFVQPDFPVERFAEIYDPIRLSALTIASVLCVGVSLGMLSSFHRGGPRPVLAGVWVLASFFWMNPVIHWLAWFAIYAILTASLQPLVTFPNIEPPPLELMDLGIDSIRLIPAFAGLGYVLGVVVGVWPRKTVGA